MAYRPRLKFGFYVEAIDPLGVFLISERRHFVLRGKAYRELVPLLDGRRTEDELVGQLEGKVPAAEVIYALGLLARKGYVVDGAEPIASERAAAFWELLDVAPGRVRERLAGASVSLEAFGAAEIAPLAAELGGLGVRVAEAGGDLRVAVTDDYERAGLREIDRQCREAGRPWLLLKPYGLSAWLGPLYVPGQTGCHACLLHRLEKHRKLETFLARRRAGGAPIAPAVAALPSTERAAFALAATEIAKWLVFGKSDALEGKVVTSDAETLERKAHTLTRRPQCPGCGDRGLVAANQRRAPELPAVRASWNDDGGRRGEAPERALARLERHVSPITGIVSYLQPMLPESGDPLIRSYAADHNFVRVESENYFLDDAQRGRSGGKGKTEAQAKASAVCESIERYSGLYEGDEAIVRARLGDLGRAAVHPNALLLFSERQLRERDKWNAHGSRFAGVPEPFDEGREIGWCPVYPLLGGEPRYVPAACCYYGYGPAHGERFAMPDSNGCAAGATLTEAAYQGLMELAERDAVALWWYSRVRRPGVDFASFGDPYLVDLAAYYGRIGRELWALDLTNDLGIPAFAALTRKAAGAAEDIVFGFGAHLDAKVALGRAVTECNQMLPAVFFASPDRPDSYRGDPLARRWWKTATLASEPYLAPAEGPPRRLADFAAPAAGDLRDDLLACARALGRKGYDVYLLDQSRPDADVAVVKVFAPGLRHFWARFAPGRLYDAPVELGWLPRALAEEELNPFPMFL
jgi:bacteriocin biosynthesis cyclodehydratase domain-containing protein